MLQGAEIIDYLGEGKFVVTLPEDKEWDGNPHETDVIVAHDYIQFNSSCPISMKPNDKGEYPYKSKGVCNWKKARASIQISIRDFKYVVLPFLQNHPELVDEKFKDEEYINDDENFKQNGHDEPRWRKGDKYPNYAYNASIIRYRDPVTGIMMVKFRRCGEKHYGIMDLKTFVTIKDSLALSYREHEKKQFFDGRQQDKS